MTSCFILILLPFFFLLACLYFKIADQYNIIDKPNERSSHSEITIRGGGILFPIGWIIYSVVNGFVLPYVTIGVFLIALIGFLDDRMDISSLVRLVVHLISFSLCFYQLNLFNILDWWWIPILYIVCIGCINAVNFMDGINGITGMYSLAFLLPLLSISSLDQSLSWKYPFAYLIASILVFGYYNFRKKAKCFAGDVGSVSMGFILVFFILGLVFYSPDWIILGDSQINNNFACTDLKYVLLLTLYGIDAVLTIVQRMYLKENIFKAHRRHLYQYLANEMQWSHLKVSAIYAIIQCAINIWVLSSEITLLSGLSLLVILSGLYVMAKRIILTKFKS